MINIAKTLKDTVEIVASDFKATMTEEGFDTFEEMKSCYDWSSSDVKAEVEAILKFSTIGSFDCYLSDDGADIIGCVDVEEISYRKFMSLVYKRIKEL